MMTCGVRLAISQKSRLPNQMVALIAHTSQQLFPQPQPTTTFPKVTAQLDKKKA